MATPRISIPKPCAQPWDAMMPTAAGRHCAACQTEVVDFSRMSDAEVLAYVAARQGRRVCGYIAAPSVLPVHYKRSPSGWRRWLLAAAVLLGWRPASALGLPPQELPVRSSWPEQSTGAAMVTIRGVVLDDSLNVPVAGARIYVGNTKYGVVANARGEFSLSFPANWEPAKNGTLKLTVGRVPFALLEQTIEVKITGNPKPAPLTIRLQSEPDRGYIRGRAVLEKPPVALPDFRRKRR